MHAIRATFITDADNKVTAPFLSAVELLSEELPAPEVVVGAYPASAGRSYLAVIVHARVISLTELQAKAQAAVIKYLNRKDG